MASRPRDLADRMAGRRKLDDGYLRETFTLPRDKARTTARDYLTRYPKAAYMSGSKAGANCPAARSNSPCGGCPAPTSPSENLWSRFRIQRQPYRIVDFLPDRRCIR
jgi:hypothetical protein